ncbi:hypothetical protein [Thermoplasma volcanium GSS1]|uniref:Uncharacterized protein TV0719 n=1 Tax=Thermoplasma volcanium (strain ATCC 51530 / DSM 4299 / JCM 9571 / NBRC 15438 / GSS1) TaxID=273116 RepID=Y719_THEVO|nr:O-acetyl-ADP-ribose deacetylase [Thermoplasma volcanium]Q97AU0.1 RecName: Full=Uncharacterized protein TV0719 [Thermoplasma volcanium GSS1]BAB59861.1 hypothetical protein [Thermoplasma volcanium GSS1]
MVSFSYKGNLIEIIEGDITDVNCEAIVNAANPSLMGGGGVDGAIHLKGGKTIDLECAELRRTKWPKGLPPGEADITSGGKLKAKYVIHTVGPIYRGQEEDAETLYSSYYRSLEIAKIHGIKCIAFPAISTGIYGYPFEEASVIALKAVTDFLSNKEGYIIKFVLYGQARYQTFVSLASDFLMAYNP